MNNKQNNTKPTELRMTRQRRVILEELGTPNHHPTADAIYHRVRLKIPNISLGTVYRNLEVLSQSGQIRKLHVGSSQKQFDGALHPHYHVRCIQCGHLSDLPSEPFGDLEATARGNSGFNIVGHELEFEGLCEQCMDTSPKPSEKNQEQ
ncbi:MAG: transcriptional repressor [bacterium]|nr:transcriptional repressor [bacterium]